jgi:signal transduction histidine kinase
MYSENNACVFQIDIDKLTENAIDLFKAAEKYALQGLKVSIASKKLRKN